MVGLSVAQAAERLDVGVARIHQRIADGSLRAERIGSQWVVEETSLLNASDYRAPGRPLSGRSAWALIAASRGDEPRLATLTATERSRAHNRLVRLAELIVTHDVSEQGVQEAAALLRSWFRNRAERCLLRVSPQDLPDLREDSRLALGGISHSLSGIAAGDMVEGYLSGDSLDDLIEDYLLSRVDRKGNVVLHLSDPRVRDVDAPLLIAVDLADHRDPRTEARAVDIVCEAAEMWNWAAKK